MNRPIGRLRSVSGDRCVRRPRPSDATRRIGPAVRSELAAVVLLDGVGQAGADVVLGQLGVGPEDVGPGPAVDDQRDDVADRDPGPLDHRRGLRDVEVEDQPVLPAPGRSSASSASSSRSSASSRRRGGSATRSRSRPVVEVGRRSSTSARRSRRPAVRGRGGRRGRAGRRGRSRAVRAPLPGCARRRRVSRRDGGELVAGEGRVELARPRPSWSRQAARIDAVGEDVSSGEAGARSRRRAAAKRLEIDAERGRAAEPIGLRRESAAGRRRRRVGRDGALRGGRRDVDTARRCVRCPGSPSVRLTVSGRSGARRRARHPSADNRIVIREAFANSSLEFVPEISRNRDRANVGRIQPRRRARPGVAPVGSPFSRARVPLTRTWSTPSARVRPAA